jgi:uncharacterized protein (DUF305 family)
MTRIVAATLSVMLICAAAQADEAASPAAQQSAADETMLGMMTMRPGAEMSEADRGYLKAMQAMQQAMMKTEMTGNASGDFARMMILHHQSAIEMVDVLLAQKDIAPDVMAMAGHMREQQAHEIVALQTWLQGHPD